MTIVETEVREKRTGRTGEWRKSFVALHGARCHYCNRVGSMDMGPGGRPWHVDHMHPIARGGSDEESNLTLACKRCNLTKSATPYEEFRDFARAAFWTPDDHFDTGELDALMAAWSEASEYGHLWFHPGEQGEHSEVWDAPEDEGPMGVSGAPVLMTFMRHYRRGRSQDERTAHFLVAAHRAMPRLIAEIRMLRGGAA